MNRKLYVPLARHEQIRGPRCGTLAFSSGRTVEDENYWLTTQRDEADSDALNSNGWKLLEAFTLCVFLVIILLPMAVLTAKAETGSGIISERYESKAGSEGFVTEYQENYSVIADVPNGMFTTSSVSLYCANGTVSAIYRNGEPFEPELVNDYYKFRQTGAYTVVISDALDATRPSRIFTFRIIDAESADVSVMFIPDCVTVINLQIDEHAVQLSEYLSGNMLDLRTEGKYLLTWQVGNSGYRYLSFNQYQNLPLFTTETDGYSAKLSFSTGLDHIKVYQNGNRIYSAADGMWNENSKSWVLTDEEGVTKSSLSLSEVGTYMVLAYEKDGTAKLEVITLRKKLDVAGFFSILFLLAMAVALWLFFLHEKKVRSTVR